MSVWGQIKHGVHHATHKVESAGKHAEKQAEHAGKEIGKAADTSADAIEDAGKKVKEGIENMADITAEVKHEITKLINEAVDEAKKGIREAQNEATHAIQEAAKEAKTELQKDLKAIEQRLEGQTAEEVLKIAVDIIRALSPSSLPIQLGPIQVDIGDIENKVEDIVKWSKRPPHNRKTWVQFVHDVSPDSLTLIASFGFGLVIQSEDAQVEIQPTWTGDKIFEELDDILEKAGI